MPYPESCPECVGPFRNTGTHFTARRNEIGRHVLLELGCQNTDRRFWWDFTVGACTTDGQPCSVPRERLASLTPVAMSSNGSHQADTNGHASVATLDPPAVSEVRRVELELDTTPEAAADAEPAVPEIDMTLHTQQDPGTGIESVSALKIVCEPTSPAPNAQALHDRAAGTVPQEVPGPVSHHELSPVSPTNGGPAWQGEGSPVLESEREAEVASSVELSGPVLGASPSLREAFVRQLQLDRLTLRQMRSWLMSEEARRAIEVAAGATEATYERLALILFGVDLSQLSGKPAAVPATPGVSAEERLELQREKARIRARVRRAAAKAHSNS